MSDSHRPSDVPDNRLSAQPYRIFRDSSGFLHFPPDSLKLSLFPPESAIVVSLTNACLRTLATFTETLSVHAAEWFSRNCSGR